MCGCLYIYIHTHICICLAGKFYLAASGCCFPRCLFIFNWAPPCICIHKYTVVFSTCLHLLILDGPWGFVVCAAPGSWVLDIAPFSQALSPCHTDLPDEVSPAGTTPQPSAFSEFSAIIPSWFLGCNSLPRLSYQKGSDLHFLHVSVLPAPEDAAERKLRQFDEIRKMSLFTALHLTLWRNLIQSWH